MKLYGKVIKQPRDYGTISQWPYQGYIYNDQGVLLSTDPVGMTEEQCMSMMKTIATRIRNREFIGNLGLVEL